MAIFTFSRWQLVAIFDLKVMVTSNVHDKVKNVFLVLKLAPPPKNTLSFAPWATGYGNKFLLYSVAAILEMDRSRHSSQIPKVYSSQFFMAGDQVS